MLRNFRSTSAMLCEKVKRFARHNQVFFKELSLKQTVYSVEFDISIVSFYKIDRMLCDSCNICKIGKKN
jgi:hypothetical protein